MSQAIGREVPSGQPFPPFPLPDSPHEGAGRARPMVLLVDDIEDCRDVYGQFLRHTGYEVVEAEDGQEAVAAAARLRPDVIVMDLWMPRLDGWESIRRLKAAPATAAIPVLVLTGDAYAQARAEAQEAGCSAYLVKPCLPMDVAAQVGRLLTDARADASRLSAVRILSERRPGSGRRTESAGAVLAGVVADLERRYEDLGQQLHGMHDELESIHDAVRRGRLERKLRQVEQARLALERHIGSLKVIVRSAEVKITIPARRAPRKS